WQSFCRILPQKQSEVALYFLEPIAVAGKTRQQICAEAQTQVAAKLAELQGKSVAELTAGSLPAPSDEKAT
ncbi:MAG: 1-acyl-sn-glycerol-3-phosphate acyltransferase, partial [Eikenella sp.]|nr:1-acyl-sn-glycerol-3-phosphate acyltransferase [Eikenella sp.]